MTNALSMNELREMIGADAYDQDGNKIGGVEEIFMDNDTGEPEWIGLNAGGLFGSKHVVVPVEGTTRTQDGLKVRYSKDQIKDSPTVGDHEISEREEAEIYRHYGLNQRPSRMDTREGQTDIGRGLDTKPGREETGQNTTGMAGTANPNQASMTRSEEELSIGKRETSAGNVRLRKWVETEPVSEDVSLRRETAHVERHEVNRPVRGGELGEQEATVDLKREEPVVQKETVAREEITVGKEEETTNETVSGEVRKEKVDVEENVEGELGRRRDESERGRGL